MPELAFLFVVLHTYALIVCFALFKVWVKDKIEDLREEADDALTEAIENHHVAMHDDDDEASTPEGYYEFCKVDEALGDLACSMRNLNDQNAAETVEMHRYHLRRTARQTYPEIML